MNDDLQLTETGRLAELGLQAATLVHELRQPVFAVKGLAQVLLQRSPDNAQLSELLAQVERLQTLVERYSDASRRPTGTATPTDIVSAVDAGVTLVGAHRPEVEIRWAPPPVLVFAQVDPVAVQQITSNLLRNAVEAARSLVEVRLTEHTLLIIDDGPGILPEIEARLGQPFVTSKPPGEGTGLGLTVTRSLVEVIGGRFSWTTGPTGTCFKVELSHD